MRRVPDQRFDCELLDGPIADPAELQANLRDMALANRLLLSHRGILQRVARWIEQLPAGVPATVLDVATGAGGLPCAIQRWARHQGRQVRLLASDVNTLVLQAAEATGRRCGTSLIRHDALQMPYGDRSIDVVTCAFALHHFEHSMAVALLCEMARVARLGVVVSDLRRSYTGYLGARLFALSTRNRLSRHDGPLSVLRAYTPEEARVLMQEAGIAGWVHARPLFRLELAFDVTAPLQSGA
jgi:ubiquinone/menaquinone biosynthesis C-methylase UbiE